MMPRRSGLRVRIPRVGQRVEYLANSLIRFLCSGKCLTTLVHSVIDNTCTTYDTTSCHQDYLLANMILVVTIS